MTLQLGIAQVGLADADSHRLRTMSGMAATTAGLKYRWVMSDPDNADLVVVNAGSWQGESRIRIGANGYPQVIAILAGESDTVPEGCLKLRWPIRLENVVALLRVVERAIGTMDAGKVGQVVQPAKASRADHAGSDATAPSPLMQLASIVREGAVSAPDALWRVQGAGKQPLIVAPGEKAFYFAESLAGLSIGPESSLDIARITQRDAGTLEGRKPLQMLQWLVGLRSASLGLLHWMDGVRAIQLVRDPPFLILHHTPAHRRIAAALARPCADLAVLERITGADSDTITGFINAVSLCGFLASVSVDLDRTTAPIAMPAEEGRQADRRSRILSFRRALGITSAND